MRGRVSPGKSGPKVRQIPRGKADRTGAFGADSGGDSPAVHNRCRFQCFSTDRARITQVGAEQPLFLRKQFFLVYQPSAVGIQNGMHAVSCAEFHQNMPDVCFYRRHTDHMGFRYFSIAIAESHKP